MTKTKMILDILTRATEPMTARDIAERVGIGDPQTARQLLIRLVKRGVVSASGSPLTYAMVPVVEDKSKALVKRLAEIEAKLEATDRAASLLKAAGDEAGWLRAVKRRSHWRKRREAFAPNEVAARVRKAIIEAASE